MDPERRKRHFYRRWTAIASWITGISIGSLALIVIAVLVGVAIFVRTETFQNSLRDRILQLAREELGIELSFESARVEIFSLEPKIHFENVNVQQPQQNVSAKIERISAGISVLSLPLLAFRQLVLASAELEGLRYEINSTKIFDKWVTTLRPRSGLLPVRFQTSVKRVELTRVTFAVDLPQSDAFGHRVKGEVAIKSIQVNLSSDQVEISGLSELKNFQIDDWGPYSAELTLDRATQKGEGFNFRRLELKNGADHLGLSGTIQNLKDPALDVRGDIDFDLGSFLPNEQLAGKFSSDFELRGPWKDPTGRGRSQLTGGRWRVKKLDKAEAEWEVSSRLVKLSKLQWRDGGETGSGKLDVSLTGDKKVVADLNVENSDLSSYLPLLEEGLRNWRGMVRGGIRFEGQIGQSLIGTIKGDLELNDFQIRSFGSSTEILKVPKLRVQTTGELKSVSVGVLTATVETGASQWTGSLDWSKERLRLVWDSKFNGQYFGDLFNYKLSPSGSLPGSYEGPWSHLVLLAQPNMKNFVFHGQDINNLTGLLKLERRSLLALPFKSDQIDLSGGIHFPEKSADVFEDLKFTIRNADFQKVLGFLNVTPDQSWNAKGKLFAEGGLSGPVELPNGFGKAELQDWSFFQAKQRGRKATAKWACSRGDFYIQEAELMAISPSDIIRAEATIDTKGFSNISLDGDRARLSDWAAVTETHFPFQAYTNFSLNYQRDVPSLRSEFHLTEMSYEGNTYQDSKFEFNWIKNQLSLVGQLFGDSLSVELKGSEAGAQREYSLKSTMKDANLAAFLPGVATSQMEFLTTGTAEIHGSQAKTSNRNLLSGLLTENIKMDGSIDVESAMMKRALQVLQKFKPFSVDVSTKPGSGNVRLESRLIEVESNERSMRLSGYFENKLNFRLDIAGGTELRALAAFIPTMSRSEGILDIQGRWEPKGFTGSIEVTRGLLTFQDSPLVIREVEATLRAANSDFQVHRFSGNFREGNMGGSGFFKLREAGIVNANLGLRFDHILLQPLEGLSFRASGPIDLRVENNSGEVRGKLYITDGLFRRRVDLRSDLANFFKEERRSFRPRDYEKAAWRQWKMNVAIQTTDPFNVRNNLGEGAANFNLAVRGTAGHPYLEGSVDIIRGQYNFNQKEFTIRSGSVLFRNGDSNIPNYDIRSETEIGDHRVTTRLQGGPGFQKIQYSSEPPLSEKDILSLIQFGLPASSEEFKDQDAQRSLSFSGLSFVTGGIQDKIETRLSKDLGIQRFQLTPAFFEETGRTELQLTLGTDLVKNKLAINYSNYLSAAGGHRLELDFKVNRNVSLIGSWRDVRLEQGKTGESTDDFGADVRFRFEIE